MTFPNLLFVGAAENCSQDKSVVCLYEKIEKVYVTDFTHFIFGGRGCFQLGYAPTHILLLPFLLKKNYPLEL